MDALRNAADLFRRGVHQQATAALNQVLEIPSPQVVEVGMQLLREPLAADSCYTHFYAARVVRTAVVRDWAGHWHTSSKDIISFVLQFIGAHETALAQAGNKPLLSEMATLWAVVWKLQCATSTDGDGTFEQLRDAVRAIVGAATNDSFRIIVRSVVTCLVEEFGRYQGQSRARTLPVASHERCRRVFKDSLLHPLYEVSFQWGLDMHSESPKSAAALAQLWYTLLCWNFASTFLDVQENADAVPEILPCEGAEWQQLLGAGVRATDGSMVPVADVLMKWLAAFHNANDITSRGVVLQCILQLCSITGVEWPMPLRWEHLTRMLTVVFVALPASLGSSAAIPEVLRFRSSALLRLITASGCVECVFTHPNIIQILIQPLRELTQSIIHEAHAGASDDDEDVRIEAVDHILKTWLELIYKGFTDITVLVSLPKELETALSAGAAEVLGTFVAMKIAEATKCDSATGADVPESHFSKEYAESQTRLLGFLGREQPAVTAGYLSHVLREYISQCIGQLEQRRMCSESVSEVLWFILSVAAQMVSDGTSSERTSIPNSIVSLAIQWERQHPDDLAAQEKANEVLAMMRLVVGFAAQAQPFLSTGLVSPGVSTTVLQFLRHVCSAYLFPEDSLVLESDNTSVFSTMFESGVVLADCALQWTASCLTAFPFDTDVTSECCKLLTSLTNLPATFGDWVCQQKPFHYLVRLAAGAVSGCTLSGSIKGSIIGFLVSVCPCEHVVSCALDPIAQCLRATIERGASTLTGQLVDIGVVVEAIDSLAGAFSALKNNDQTRVVFAALAPLVDGCGIIVQLHALHKPLLVSVLKLMNTIVLSCSFLAASHYAHVVQLGIGCIDITKTAMDTSRAMIQQGMSKESASQEEDERVEVLSCAATFVESVATWGLMDMNMDGDDSSRADLIPELAVRGLLAVLAYCDAHVLGIPQLRDTVFSLLQEVSSSYTSRFLSVTPDEANALMQATEFSLSSSVPSLNRSGFKVMESIASYCCRHGVQFELLSRFANTAAQVIATAALDSSVFPSVAMTLFALCGACTPQAILQAILATFRNIPLLERPFVMVQELFERTNFGSRSRDTQNKFTRDVESILLVVSGTKIV